MSFVQERSRRATAGKRMTTLVGKALEEDSAFWGHETWENESGEESYNSNDEDPQNKVDVFDSDFDDSESDSDDDNNENEAEVLRLEKEASKRIGADISKAGRDLMKKTKSRALQQKRALGQGLNAGLVLHLPATLSTDAIDPTSTSATAAISSNEQQQQINAQAAVAHPQTVKSTQSHHHHHHHKIAEPALAATRPRRAGGFSKYSSRYRAARNDAHPDNATSTVNGAHGSNTSDAVRRSAVTGKKKKRQRYEQQDLLLEAVNDTEPENERWRLARKRMQQENEAIKEAAAVSSNHAGGKIVERFVSRRGYPNTIHFPEMDHLPPVLTVNNDRRDKKQKTRLCVITQQPAKYRDPLTGHYYADSTAFKELRQQYKDGTLKAAGARSDPKTAKKRSRPTGKAGAGFDATEIDTKMTDDTATTVVASSTVASVHQSTPQATKTSTVATRNANIYAESAITSPPEVVEDYYNRTSCDETLATARSILTDHIISKPVTPSMQTFLLHTATPTKSNGDGSAGNSVTKDEAALATTPIVVTKTISSGGTAKEAHNITSFIDDTKAVSSSPVRHSSRKHKPSAKMLESDVLVATVPSLALDNASSLRSDEDEDKNTK